MEQESADASAAAERRDVERVIAFSDGVYAIAITLLVLSIQVPDVADKNLGDAMRDVVPQLFTYALSFAVIGRYWVAHHRMFRSVRRVDSTLLAMNLVLLGFVALLPFPTELLGKYADTSLATIIYAAAILAVGSMSTLTSWYIDHAELMPPVSAETLQLNLLRGAVPPAVFGLSIPVALASPTAGKLSWLLMIPANVMLEHHFKNAPPD